MKMGLEDWYSWVIKHRNKGAGQTLDKRYINYQKKKKRKKKKKKKDRSITW